MPTTKTLSWLLNAEILADSKQKLNSVKNITFRCASTSVKFLHRLPCHCCTVVARDIFTAQSLQPIVSFVILTYATRVNLKTAPYL